MLSKVRTGALISALAMVSTIAGATEQPNSQVKLPIDLKKPVTTQVIIELSKQPKEIVDLNKVLVRHGFTMNVDVFQRGNEAVTSKIVGQKTGVFSDSDFNSTSSEITKLAAKIGGKVTWGFLQKQ